MECAVHCEFWPQYKLVIRIQEGKEVLSQDCFVLNSHLQLGTLEKIQSVVLKSVTLKNMFPQDYMDLQCVTGNQIGTCLLNLHNKVIQHMALPHM
jgi:hypothetical protein